MDELFAIWASWSPEAREKVLNVHNVELVSRIDASMRLLWTNEIKGRADKQGALQSPADAFDYSRYPLTSTMQFEGMVMQDQKVYRIVKWPKELLRDPATVPTAVRSAAGRRQHGAKRVNPARWAQAFLQPPPKSWSDFEQQLANLIEQLVLHAHSAQVGTTGRAGGSNNKSGPSGAVGSTLVARAAEIEVEDQLLGVDRSHDGEAADSAGEDGTTAAELTGRAAKRARQRERRRMFKAAARAAGGDASAAAVAGGAEASSAPAVANATSGPSGTASRPSPVITSGAPSVMPSAMPSAMAGARSDPLIQGMRCAPPSLGAARGANSPVGIGLTRPQGAGGGRRTDSPVWQPPGIWEPARINLSEAADLGPLDADDLADAEAPQLQDFSGDEDDEGEATENARAGGATESHISGAAADTASGQLATEAEVASLPSELPDATEPAKVVPEVAQAGEPAKVVAEAAKIDEAGDAASKEPVKVLEDGEMNPWSGRPVSGPGSLIFGVGRGKPLATEDAEGRWGDSFGSMGMGRGRALTPPPGLSMRKYHRAPGGLAQTWMPGPSIPEEDGDDPEKQTMTEDVPAQGDIGGWLHNMQFADHLASALSRGPSSSWSQASFANTPSMAWSKTPSPPSTPINQRLPGRQGAAAGAFSTFSLPDAWQGAMPGGMPGGMAHGVAAALGPGSTPMAGPIPLYVTVPIAMAHSCPHCGRAFALPPDESARGSGGDGSSEEAPT